MPSAALIAPSSLSVVVSLRRLSSSMSRSSFPPTVLFSDHPFPPPGPLERVPRFHRSYEWLRLPAPFPPHFVAFAWRYHRKLRVFAPRAGRRLPLGPGDFSGRDSPLDRVLTLGGDGRFSQVPGKPHCGHALLFDPGGAARARPYSAAVLPSVHAKNVGPRDNNSFVAQSHGLSTRCLRFVGMVTASQRKTRFRRLAKLGRMGLVTHWVSSKGFNHRCFLQRVSSFSRLILAHLR